MTSSTHPDEMRALAHRLFDAVARGDTDAVRAIYAPDAVIWHNYDGVAQTVDDNLRTLAAAARALSDWRYDDVRLQVTEDGFLQQHVMRAHAPSGAEFALAACIVCTVVGGRITRLDEYFDPAQLAALRGR
jgi:ketosteroid isomerase-like protein